MNNKTITLALIGIILVIFISYFILQNTVFDTRGPINNLLGQISQSAQQGDWGKAGQLNSKLEQIWKRYKVIIMLNYAEEDYSTFGTTLTRLKAAVETKDTYLAVSEALVAKGMWLNLTKCKNDKLQVQNKVA